MPTDEIVGLLLEELNKINGAIEALQGQRPGHVAAILKSTRKKRHVSAAARRKMAAAQKARWAAIKAAK